MGSVYLASYNIILFLSWATILGLIFDVITRQHGSSIMVYRAIELPLMVAQTTAIMEVVHSAVGLVRSPVAITAMQVASRLWIVWGVIVPIQGETITGAIKMGQAGPVSLEFNLLTLLVAWCLSELIRYSFFAMKEIGWVPYVLLWLRYSAFILLYPLGVASELTMVWLALPEIKRSGMWSYRMPNPINFGFDYYAACLIIMLVYIPGLPQLYSYMLKQRKKMLNPPVALSSVHAKKEL